MDERRHQSPFSPATLAALLAHLPSVKRYWLAYSGGRDSHVLVHAAAQLQQRDGAAAFRAVHVDHGLHPGSDAWARHCAAVCADLDLPLTSLRVNARGAPGDSPEAAARRARYRAMAELIEAGDCLLTAHHQDDQAETLLLQLLRGGGPHGLAAMPALTTFAGGLHARPLLSHSRAELQAYGERVGLRWIEDPSNVDTGFDRNYLRGAVMPLLRERWPAMDRVLTRAAGHQAEAGRLLDALAEQDLAACRVEHAACLSIPALLRLDAARQRNVLRYWLKGLGFNLPDSARLAHVQRDVLHAGHDRMPLVRWAGAELRRHRDRLYALRPQPPLAADTVFDWDLRAPLCLPDGAVLSARPTQGEGVKAALFAQGVTLRFRQGGEQCRSTPGGPMRPLKKLLQEHGMPPWRRARIPLVYVGERLAAVADLWVCAPFHAVGEEEGVCFEWRQAESSS